MTEFRHHTREQETFDLKGSRIYNIPEGTVVEHRERYYLCVRAPKSEYSKEHQLRSPKVYLAGPMRGKALHNFPAFLTAAAWLRSKGFEVVSPADHDLEAGFDMTRSIEEQKFDIQKALGWDFQAIVNCDGVVLIDGWENSEGAKAERLVASMSGKFALRLTADLKLSDDPNWKPELRWVPDLAKMAKPAEVTEVLAMVEEPQEPRFINGG